MSATDPASQGGWHLDRRIPLALIITLGLQTAAFVWFLSNLNSRVDSHAAAQVRFEQRLQVIEQERTDLRDRITRLEVLIEGQNRVLTDILDTLRTR